ncbi:MAG TPA: hypothetical protein VMY41_11755 [Thermohalobaculum sp.]|nr:hypothetical protein [Thermohalobaculum sp.]
MKANIDMLRKMRNYFAHKFMREESPHMASDSGCWFLLVKMAKAGRAIIETENELVLRFKKMNDRMGFPTFTDEIVNSEVAKFHSEALIAVENGTATVGWE